MPNRSTFPQRRSPRLPGYDYAQPATYLVTIGVDGMEHRLGRIVAGTLHLNAAGEMVAGTWQRTPARFAGIAIDVFVVMPNHFHGIISIGTDSEREPPTLSRVIQAFKSETAMEYTRGVHTGAYPPYRRSLWLRSFHHRILPNERAPDSARAYVLDNPRKWQEEREQQG